MFMYRWSLNLPLKENEAYVLSELRHSNPQICPPNWFLKSYSLTFSNNPQKVLRYVTQEGYQSQCFLMYLDFEMTTKNCLGFWT